MEFVILNRLRHSQGAAAAWRGVGRGYRVFAMPWWAGLWRVPTAFPQATKCHAGRRSSHESVAAPMRAQHGGQLCSARDESLGNSSRVVHSRPTFQTDPTISWLARVALRRSPGRRSLWQLAPARTLPAGQLRQHGQLAELGQSQRGAEQGGGGAHGAQVGAPAALAPPSGGPRTAACGPACRHLQLQDRVISIINGLSFPVTTSTPYFPPHPASPCY
jgi:hypothetical protein